MQNIFIFEVHDIILSKSGCQGLINNFVIWNCKPKASF